MRICLILLISFSCLVTASAQAEIYKTKDKSGRVVYTDQPAANDTKAKIVELPAINQLPSVNPTAVVPPEQAPAEEINYHLEIISPAPDTRLEAGDRNLSVTISANQLLQPEHFFVYFLNGKKIQESKDLSITIVEPPRGENKLHVEVMDKYGKSFGQSDPVTVFVFRPIVKH